MPDLPLGPRLEKGDMVRLRTDQTRRGVITDGPRPHGGGFEYQVFFGDNAWYDQSLLELVPNDRPRWVRPDELLRDLVLAKMRHPLTDGLYAYRASRTVYEPYQFRPALKLLRSGGRGLLIADEVGLGKTIEAAIIYLELKARMDISRVLVLCPAGLKAKWQDELRNRFEEEFEILDAARTRRLLDDFRRVGNAMPIRAIASFNLLRQVEFVQQLEEHNIPFDLLIVDEAHHMRNEGTRTSQLGETLVDAADVVLLLTATPLHLRTQDLFNLLTLLAPEDFNNSDLFEEQVRPNENVNRAIGLVASGDLSAACTELRRVEETLLRERFLQNPYYRDVVARLRAANGLVDRAERVAIQRELMDLNTLASVFTRTRKREVARAAVRAPYTVRVTLSPAERAFYDGVLGRTREELRARQHGATGFATIMKERQAASCLPALRERFAEAARRHTPVQLGIDRSAFDLHPDDGDEQATPIDDLDHLSLQLGDHDTKFDRFEQVLREALGDDGHSKALVFSYFKGTLEYLRRRLRARGLPVEVIHGDVPVAERRRIIEWFRTTAESRVLLSSEVGAEGLDFQFCDVLVNYDLPWNPMQVEQRIGRLDRFGQTAERIRIYNFYIEDTIETRIFQRLYDRIGLFERSIGDLEAILGEEIIKLSREALQARLTPEEETRLAIQAAERIIRRQQDEDELDRHKDELLGQGAILDQQIDGAITSGRFISANEVRALVGLFVHSGFPNSRLVYDDEEPCATIDFDAALADYVRRVIETKRLHQRASAQFLVAMNERRRLPFTFDSDYARRRPNLEFITVSHPLAEAARTYWISAITHGIPAGEVLLDGPADESGDGYFFVYLVDVQAVAPTVTFEPVIVLDDGRLAVRTAHALLRELQDGTRVPIGIDRSDRNFEAAEQIAAGVIAAFRASLEGEARRRNEALLAARASSIRASFEAKIARAQKLLDEATDERIQRMRRAQLLNLRAKMDAKLDELSNRREVAVSSTLVIGGRIRIAEG